MPPYHPKLCIGFVTDLIDIMPVPTVHAATPFIVCFRLASLLVLLFEAPICCQFFNYAKALSDFAERRSFMQKALIYVGFVSMHI